MMATMLHPRVRGAKKTKKNSALHMKGSTTTTGVRYFFFGPESNKYQLMLTAHYGGTVGAVDASAVLAYKVRNSISGGRRCSRKYWLP
jgi:hypothetical protein